MLFSAGTVAHVDAAARAAEAAFPAYSALSRDARAGFLDAIADEIEARGPDITWIGCLETGLPPARLEGSGGGRPASCGCSRPISARAIIWTAGWTRPCRTASRCRGRKSA